MRKLLTNPYFYIWATLLIILVYRYIMCIKIGGSALDINVHDTYFVTSYLDVTFILCLIYLTLGLIYFLFEIFKVHLNCHLTIVHVVLTVLSILSYPLGKLYYFKTDFTGYSLLHPHSHRSEFNDFLLILTLIAQLFLIINIIVSLFKHFTKKTLNC